MWRDCARNGQATLEFLLVGLVLMIMAVGLAALWHYSAQGKLGALVELHASHDVTAEGGAADVLAF